MDRLNDPAVLALPHPVRFDAAGSELTDTELFEQFGLMTQLRPWLNDPSACTEWILNHVPGVKEVAIASSGAPGDVNIGSFMLLLMRARLRAHGDPIIEVTPTLQTLLGATDLTAGLPARYFRSPYPLVFIALARPNGLQVYNGISGLHECEGAYVGMYDLPPYHPVHDNHRRTAALRLDPALPTRAVEIVITGSPVGKRDAFDDASQDMLLLIQDEDECLSSVLERHISLLQSRVAYTNPLFTPMLATEVAPVTPVVFALAKVLLYLHLPEAEQVRLGAREELARRLRNLGPKKAARLTRRMATAYDRILLGPSSGSALTAAVATGPAESPRSLRPHWRRGHFRRIRFGEQLRDSRLGWIQPCLVNAADAFGAVKTKPYTVR